VDATPSSLTGRVSRGWTPWDRRSGEQNGGRLRRMPPVPDPMDLTDDLIVLSGGWNPQYARVVMTAVDDDVAIVLVDGNGDGAELEMEYWEKGADGWVGGSASGYGPLGGMRWTNRWDAGQMVCAVGEGVPGESVRLRYDGEVCECTVNQFGLWGFVRKVEHMGVKHPLPEPLDEDDDIAEARGQSEAKMEVIRERIRGTLQSRMPPTT
jgi:hypothetical protein